MRPQQSWVDTQSVDVKVLLDMGYLSSRNTPHTSHSKARWHGRGLEDCLHRRERISFMQRYPCFAVGRSGNDGIPSLLHIGLPSTQFDSISGTGPYLILLDSNPIFTTLSAKLKLPRHHLIRTVKQVTSIVTLNFSYEVVFWFPSYFLVLVQITSDDMI